MANEGEGKGLGSQIADNFRAELFDPTLDEKEFCYRVDFLEGEQRRVPILVAIALAYLHELINQKDFEELFKKGKAVMSKALGEKKIDEFTHTRHLSTAVMLLLHRRQEKNQLGVLADIEDDGRQVTKRTRRRFRKRLLWASLFAVVAGFGGGAVMKSGGDKSNLNLPKISAGSNAGEKAPSAAAGPKDELEALGYKLVPGGKTFRFNVVVVAGPDGKPKVNTRASAKNWSEQNWNVRHEKTKGKKYFVLGSPEFGEYYVEVGDPKASKSGGFYFVGRQVMAIGR